MSNKLAVLTENDLRKFAPAVFAREGAPKRTSKRYVPLPTIDVVRVLEKEGFRVTAARQDNTRRRDPKYARHMLRFTHKDDLDAKVKRAIGDTVPQVVLTGSANGTAPFELRAGLFRLICTNGMVIPVIAGGLHTKHIYVTPDDVIKRVKELAAKADASLTTARAWAAKHLTEKQRLAFAREALKLRHANEKGRYKAADLLVPRREADAGNDLWSVFNRVQEQCTQGGFIGQSANNRVTRARPLGAIIRDVSFNEKLWALAEKFAGNGKAH